MKTQKKANFYSLNKLLLYTELLDTQYEDCQERLELFRQVKSNPTSMDDEIIQRTIRLTQEQLEDQWVFVEQLNRWKKENPTEDQEKELYRLEQRLQETKEFNEEIMEIMESIKGKTINKILEMDEMELLMKTLSGEIPLPKL